MLDYASVLASAAVARNRCAVISTWIRGFNFYVLNCLSSSQKAGFYFVRGILFYNFIMFILRWVCWVLSLFPWPLWRKIHSSPYLHFSALLTCCQHWANPNSSQSLSWLPARCPQQGGCFENILHCWVYIVSWRNSSYPLCHLKHTPISERSCYAILSVLPR